MFLCMVHHHQLRKREAEALCHFRVDIPVASVQLGARLSELVEWCGANVEAHQWAHYGHVDRIRGEAPRNYARFYFLTEADADLFWRRWCIRE